ncbi:MAG: diaminopropionate ammonia-lyase [Actinobacteria bacterium]|nr:diaminopropionate ammonia-lyase [Actinomycetota bacterium]
MADSRLVTNPRVDRPSVAAGGAAAPGFHASLPGFAPTPIRPAPTTARRLGVRAVLVKDESSRMGMPSFKILGASWACYRALLAKLGQEPGAEPSLSELHEVLEIADRDLVLVAATDGNHGRAVARMARILGLPAIVLVPAGTVASRIEGIESEGAEVRVVDGTYDDTIAASAALEDDRHVVVDDTSWEGYTEVPGWVIDGYGTMLAEVVAAIEAGEVPEPTVVAGQMGVGALSAAIARAFARRPARLIVGVEPTRAACITESALAGRLVTVPAEGQTCMAGLNCGTPSEIALPSNLAGYDALVAVEDRWAEEAVRLLHADGIDAGESGAAGLAGLLAEREALGLVPEDVVLVFLTEGPTDPENFRRIIEG